MDSSLEEVVAGMSGQTGLLAYPDVGRTGWMTLPSTLGQASEENGGALGSEAVAVRAECA